MPDDPLRSRLRTLAADGNLDLEDISLAVEAARAGGRVTAGEAALLRAALAADADLFEPAARGWLEAVLAGKDPPLPNRVLLGPLPRGAPRELHHARTDVVALQEALGALGHPVAIDGAYGPGTARAVAAFQASASLRRSGAVDSATLLRMNAALDARGRAPLDLTPRARIRPDAVIAAKGRGPEGTVRALQAALDRLGAHFGEVPMRSPVDGTFGEGTEAAVRVLQRRAFLPETGLLDTATLAALEAALAAVGLDATGIPAVPAPAAGAVELHFYPGDAERRVYVLRRGQVLDRYGMVGGQNRLADDPRNPTVDYGPSPQGEYEVVEISPHVSGAWGWSYVPYGAHLREVDGEIEFRDGSGQWRIATGPKSVFAGRNPPAPERGAYLRPDGTLEDAWRKNDFGHLRARLRSVRTGALQGHMIHSSPSTEETAAYFDGTEALLDPEAAVDVLAFSHGCEHVHPRDFDEMVAKGYLAPGARFVVHGYDEVFGSGEND